MTLKNSICCILFSFGLTGVAQSQTILNFKYECSDFISDKTHASVYLKDTDDKIQLFSDAIRELEKSITIPSKEDNYILSVEFENKTIGKKILDYPFILTGNESDIEINVRLNESNRFDKSKKVNGIIKIIKYYKADNNVEIKYLPKLKGDEYYKAPFFLLKNNSNDTIYGQYIKGYFWGSISLQLDSVWSNDYFGRLDYNFAGGSPLFPDSVTIAQVGSFGWRNELPKAHYKYTLLYTTDKNTGTGVKQHSEKDNFVWWADTKRYYRLIYKFDIE